MVSRSINIAATTTAPNRSCKKLIYFVRHAQATHNVKEKEAVQNAVAKGELRKCEHEKARKSVLQDPSLKDAPLSDEGIAQAQMSNAQLSVLMNYSKNSQYQPPQVVLVSPLRRALMTATELFGNNNNSNTSPYHHPSPRFIAIEALREKRTGLACDERSSVETLKAEFPHVDFSDVQRGLPVVPSGEDNAAVRARGRIWMENSLPFIDGDSIAIVSHKGWLREMRHTLKGWVDDGHLSVDFDIEDWHQTLFGNAEIRIAKFGWSQNNSQLVSIVSRSVHTAVANVVEELLHHHHQQQQEKEGKKEPNILLEQHLAESGISSSMPLRGVS